MLRPPKSLPDVSQLIKFCALEFNPVLSLHSISSDGVLNAYINLVYSLAHI